MKNNSDYLFSTKNHYSFKEKKNKNAEINVSNLNPIDSNVLNQFNLSKVQVTSPLTNKKITSNIQTSDNSLPDSTNINKYKISTAGYLEKFNNKAITPQFEKNNKSIVISNENDQSDVIDSDKDDDTGSVSSPSSMTASTLSSSSFHMSLLNILPNSFDLVESEENSIKNDYILKHKKPYYYFDTYLNANDMIDSSLFQRVYKPEVSISGKIRYIHHKVERPELGKKIFINNTTVAIFRYYNKCYAIDNTCCHQGGPLYLGDIEDLSLFSYNKSQNKPEKLNKKKHKVDPCVICPYHGWKFHLETGRCETNENYSQKIYPCKVDHGRIFIGFEQIDKTFFEESTFDF